MAQEQAQQTDTQAETQVTVTVYVQESGRALACECGQFSADAGDYFMRRPDKPLHCRECDTDMELRQRIGIVGRTADGRPFWATGWEVVKASGVTIADLTD